MCVYRSTLRLYRNSIYSNRRLRFEDIALFVIIIPIAAVLIQPTRPITITCEILAIETIAINLNTMELYR